MKSDNVVEK